MAPRRSLRKVTFLPVYAHIQAVTDHAFEDRRLLERCLTHKSASRTENYERLEFLGDRLLGREIAFWLYHTYPKETEGLLSRRLASLVRGETLSSIFLACDLTPFVRLSDEFKVRGGLENPGLQSDVVEALVAALFLDGGQTAMQGFIQRYWRPLLETPLPPKPDPKTCLQLWAQRKGLKLPVYQLKEQAGRDHAPRFTYEVGLESVGQALGSGASKQKAQQQAARRLLDQLLQTQTKLVDEG